MVVGKRVKYIIDICYTLSIDTLPEFLGAGRIRKCNYMNFASLKKHDELNGPGARVTLFVSGCVHNCKGCINPKYVDFNYGKLLSGDVIDTIYRAANHDYIAGLNILGGEPLAPQNQPVVLKVMQKFKEIFPHKSIWCFSGYDFENEILPGKIGDSALVKSILSLVDVLVNGKYKEEEKDDALPYTNSRNQRLIDVKKTLAAGKTVLWEAVAGPAVAE